MIRGIYAIVVLDIKRAWLDRVRMIAGVAQPLLYLFVLGAGLGGSSRLGGADYRRLIFPGVIGLSLLFSATFAAITIVFDRQIGFFKAVLVSPLPRPAIAFGRIAAGALQAFAQAAILIPFAPLAGVPLRPASVFWLLCSMLAAATTFSAIGVAVAARFTSTTVFPVVTNAILLPMFFLSGALYPLRMAPRWVQIASDLDPMTYAVDLMRGSVLGIHEAPVALSVAVLAAVIALLAWASVAVFNKGEDDSSLGAVGFRWRR